MSNTAQVYSSNFVYRPPVEPTKDVVPVALVFGSVAPPEPTGPPLGTLALTGVGI